MSDGQAEAGPMGSTRALAEEIASAAIQGVAALASVAGLAFLLARSGPSAAAVTGVIVYGVSLIVAFLASALYHGIWHRRLKRIFRTVDHCAIFILIAGTYTPIALMALWRHEGWLLLAAIWTLALMGAGLRLVKGPRFHRVAIPLYLAMGWLSLAWARTLYETLGVAPLLLFAAGGLAYTGGLLFYRAKTLPFSNPLWHLCVVAGSACFYAGIALYVLPSAS
jgi:hemolysin III